ncbi:temptin-like isoform X2 [Haliotis asinina]|uniref:temptin-like isoform X2 n=2 Tax=Haliotis asinina TaxID=109174 RepID=UPI0035322666
MSLRPMCKSYSMFGAAVLSSRWTLFIVTLLHTTSGYSGFRYKIPNGHNVPIPCNAVGMWHGVGHRHVSGGGTLNSFGQDFKDSGSEWTTELCRKDSDGDGMTNGEELADPDCTWFQGTTATPISSMISHPDV